MVNKHSEDDFGVGAIYTWKAFEEHRNTTFMILGLGSFGCRMVHLLTRHKVSSNIKFAAVDTDQSSLDRTNCDNKLLIGQKVTSGRGAEGNPELGVQAAREDQERLKEVIRKADVLLLLAGMGGGTGSGAFEVISGMAKDSGKLTIALVTRPFSSEGASRSAVADGIIQLLPRCLDTAIVLPLDILLSQVDPEKESKDSFSVVEPPLQNLVLHSTLDLVDFDRASSSSPIGNIFITRLTGILVDQGYAFVGYGTSDYDCLEAAHNAFARLLGSNLANADSLVAFITAGKDFLYKTLNQYTGLTEAFAAILKSANLEWNSEKCILGVNIDIEKINGYQVTLIAIGKRREVRKEHQETQN